MTGKKQRSGRRVAQVCLTMASAAWIVSGAVWIATAGEEMGASLGTGERPAVSTDSVGNQAVVWEDPGGGLGGRILDRFGDVIGIDFSRAPSNPAIRPDVTYLSTGELVVAWQERDDDNGISGQRYTSFGDVIGIDFIVTPSGSDPALEADGQGNFVVAWTEPLSEANVPQQAHRYRHVAQRFDRFGDVIGIDFIVGQRGPATPAAVAVHADGRFLITWEDGRSDISAQAFDMNGNPDGEPFRVNDSRVGRQRMPDVSTALDGGYTVVWEKAKGQMHAVYGRRISAFGDVIGIDFLISQANFNQPSEPSIADDGLGNSLVVWRCEQEDHESQILGRLVDLRGDVIGIEFSVGEAPALIGAASTGNATSDFVAVWQGEDGEGGDGDACIFVRQIEKP